MSYKKLVRDKIPEIIRNNGEEPIIRILTDPEYKIELEKKLLEEYNEVIKAFKDKKIEELADMIEVISALAIIEGENLDKVLEVAKEKRAKRGSFKNKIYLVGIKNEKNDIFKLTSLDIKDLFKTRNKDANKGDFGTVGILGGSKNYIGALKLANLSTSALLSGAGIVRVIVNEDLLNLIGPQILEQTIFPLKTDLSNLNESLKNLDSLAIGMGLTTSLEAQIILKQVLSEYSGKIVIEADGLNILANNLTWLKETKAQVVLTPHLKEFSRLTKISIEEIKKNKQTLAENFAKEYNLILLLKGNETIITNGENSILVTTGCPGMATAGSGDVLSGIIAGLLGYNTYNVKTVSAGAYLAGISGKLAQDKYTDISMTARNTIEFLPQAIKKIRGEE